MNSIRRGGVWIRYRCRACGFDFTDAIAGTVACPRCSSIADHEQLGRWEQSITDAN